ncbi:MAG TPA: SulP family inorganic anion transporter, partial [Actinomycetota bacterium]|nr:SulP family inorganic anion transporter [Actinomycetota bacterium]
ARVTAPSASPSRRDPAAIIPSITSGAVIGVLAVVLGISFSALVYGGRLATHLPRGVALGLVAAAVMLAITALTSGLPQMTTIPQDITAALLAVVAGGVAESIPPRSEAAFLTVLGAVAVTAALVAVLLAVLGTFRLGDLVRFAPYPVVGGFLAGTGWLLVKGGIGVVTNIPLSLGTLSSYAHGSTLVRALAGLLFAGLILVLARTLRGPFVIPAMIAAGVAAFYAVVLVSGSSIAEVEQAGWLLGPLEGGGGWEPWVLEAVGAADWGVVARQAPSMIAAAVLAALSLLLNLTGIELALGRDLDANRELRTAGAANAGAAVVGGIPGFPALSLSVLMHRMGARSRLAPLVAAAVVLLALVFGVEAVAFLPRIVLGGLIVFLGLSFLVEWVWDARTSLGRAEHGLVLTILLVIATLGFLPGVGVGLLAAMILFVLEYSRTKLVRHVLTGASYRSRVDRASDELAVLDREGEATMVLILEGFLFFGTAHALLDRIRARIATEPPLRHLILDLRRVRGADASAVMTIARLGRLAEERGFILVLAGLNGRLERALARVGVEGDEAAVRVFGDPDRALEWSEDRTLHGAGVDPAPAGRPLNAWLRDDAGRVIPADRIAPYLERHDVSAGTEILSQGAEGDDLYFIESGRVAAELVAPDGERVRIRGIHPGTVVGELGMYLGTRRTASVVAETDAVLHRLTAAALERMQDQEPDLAAAVHRTLARMLAERLSASISTIEALLA